MDPEEMLYAGFFGSIVLSAGILEERKTSQKWGIIAP